MPEAFPLKELLTAFGGFVFGALVVAFLLGRRYSLRPKKGSFAGVEYDITRFSDLTHVKFFSHVTKLALPASKSAALSQAGQEDPVALIYAGWMLVYETFVRRFGVFPSDENVMKFVQELGPQNADFIKSYRMIQESAVRDAGKVTLLFAQEYTSRAPSLAQRIDPETWVFDDSLASDLLSRLPPLRNTPELG